MPSIFWNNQEVIMVDYLEEGRTTTAISYAEEISRRRQEIVTKRRGKLTQCVLLLQDSLPAHMSQVSMAAAT